MQRQRHEKHHPVRLSSPQLKLTVRCSVKSDNIWWILFHFDHITSTASLLKWPVFTVYTDVLLTDERPDITVIHDSPLAEFRIKCEIPESENTGYTCSLFLGDNNKAFLKTGSHERNGQILCSFTIYESEFFNKLDSVKTKSASCNYSPKTDPSNSSAHSDKYNLTGE